MQSSNFRTSIYDLYEGIMDRGNRSAVGNDIFKQEVLEWLTINCQSYRPGFSRVKPEDWTNKVTINNDKSVDINSSLYVVSKEDETIPFKLNKVNGIFSIYYAKIKDCTNFPKFCDRFVIRCTSMTLQDVDMTLSNQIMEHNFGHPENPSTMSCVSLDNYVKFGKNVSFTCTRKPGFKSDDPRLKSDDVTWIDIKNFPETVMKNIKLIGIQDVVINSQVGKWPTIELVQKYFNNFKDLKHIYMSRIIRQRFTEDMEIYITDKNNIEYVKPPFNRYYD